MDQSTLIDINDFLITLKEIEVSDVICITYVM